MTERARLTPWAIGSNAGIATMCRRRVSCARETRAEEVLWAALRGRRLSGLKFRRQHPVGPFVLDFCCVESRLAVELDGGVHDGQKDRDADRDALLNAAGYRVLRFPNETVLNDLAAVFVAIAAAANEDALPRPPAPGRQAGWS